MCNSHTFSPVPESDLTANKWGSNAASAVVCNCMIRHNIFMTGTHFLVYNLFRLVILKLVLPSVIVPAPQVSVRPYP